MRYNVQLSDEAARDVRGIYDYIDEHGPGNPDDWIAGLAEQMEWMEHSAGSCAKAVEDAYSRVAIHQKLYGPFRILFTINDADVNDADVIVFTVRHSAMSFMSKQDVKKATDDS